jgi:molybdenum cofactor synthesis domain-containing protein
MKDITTGILVVSDRSSRGEREDASGPALQEAVKSRGAAVVEREIVPDEISAIVNALRRMCESCDLILTSGGTGASPRDVTPEATRRVITRELPGFGDVMRARSLPITPHAMISRATAGVAGETLVINLPGSPGGAVECLSFVAPAIPHAVDLIKGRQVE